MKSAYLKVQRWGNSLAVRIPSSIAKHAHFESGTPVEVILEENGVSVRSTGIKKLTLQARLLKFDPTLHGGEYMASGQIGVEQFE
jgi:antitoxin MazE